MKKIMILANNDVGLYKFRKELIQELVKKYEVYISLPDGKFIQNLIELGCTFVDTPINRRGINPIADFVLLLKYMRIIKNVKPNVILTYTIKPNIYGGIASRIAKIPYIANITGLGTAVENGGLLQKLIISLYRISLKSAKCIFFQNAENRQFFINNNITINKNRLIPGSGVNLEKYNFEKYPNCSEPIKFTFIGRIMKSKGIDELLEAAKKVKEIYPNVQFNLIGGLEEDYKHKLVELQGKGIIRYYGFQDDIHNFIKSSHAIINPSYHEGMSNVLLESASTGRPVLASRVPGCRETFDEGVSGFGFEVKNTDSLVETINKFIELPYEDKKNMGIAGRRKMENEFDRNIVVNAYLEEINSIINLQGEI